MKTVWKWLRVFLPFFFALLIIIGLYQSDELNIAVSLDQDWDAVLMTILASSLVIYAMVRFLDTNAETMRQQSLKHAYDEADAEMNRFLQRLDHELKNPLTVIQVTLANLSENSDSQEIITVKKTIDTQSKRIAHLVHDLRLIANPANQTLSLNPVPVTELINEVVFIVQDMLVDRSLEVRATGKSPLPHIQGDFDLLTTALYNIIENSIKYTSPQGSIQVSHAYDDTGNTIMIRVQDNGQGIPANDLPYVWEELYRSETVRGTAGSGIGLALVRRIIEKHAGHIGIESTINEGTTVTMNLPVVPVSKSSRHMSKP